MMRYLVAVIAFAVLLVGAVAAPTSAQQQAQQPDPLVVIARAQADAQDRLAGLEKEVGDLRQKVADLEQRLGAQAPAPVAAPAALEKKVAKLERSVEGIRGQANVDRARLGAAIYRIGGTPDADAKGKAFGENPRHHGPGLLAAAADAGKQSLLTEKTADKALFLAESAEVMAAEARTKAEEAERNTAALLGEVRRIAAGVEAIAARK